MLFALNFSHEAASLVGQQQIEIDRFKTPDWPYLIAEASQYRQVAVHFDIDICRPEPVAYDWDKVGLLLEETDTPYINLHLAPLAADFPGLSVGMTHGADYDYIVQRLLEDVTILARRFGPEKVIAENVPYRGAAGKVLRPAVEPEVICRLVAETGCGLLLDISHARIAAHYLGVNAREYMDALPVHALRELHFTGLHVLEDGRLQDHLPALDTDWPELEWVLSRIRSGAWASPGMLAFEYGGVGGKFAKITDRAVIAAQVPRLYGMVQDM